ncbi:MAG: isocitrate/isopropylmalate family dehydrogenase [Rickettsiales bacterium]
MDNIEEFTEIHNITITVAYGDGIGPEIMEGALILLRESNAKLTIESIEIGKRIYNMGATYGILPSSLDRLRENRILLKSPTIIPDFPDYTLRTINDKLFEQFGLENSSMRISNIIKNLEDTDWLSGISISNENFAIFETMHDAAPELAGKDVANPCGIIQATIMMLEYISHTETADKIKNAMLKTLDDGIHTVDIYRKKKSKKKVGTKDFIEAVVDRL